MSFVQFQRFESYQWLDKDQLKLADHYIEMKMKNYSDKFEYYYDMHMFPVKSFNVLKKQKNTRIGLTVCKGEIVDFLLDGKHKNCNCSKVLFNTDLFETANLIKKKEEK